jgi:hypothetical protein
MTPELHGNSAALGSDNSSFDVQVKRAIVGKRHRPLDHDADRRNKQQIVCGRHQQAMAADVHYLCRASFRPLSLYRVVDIHLDGLANPSATVRNIELRHFFHLGALRRIRDRKCRHGGLVTLLKPNLRC